MMNTITADRADFTPTQSAKVETHQAAPKANSMGKIFWIVGIAIVVFMAFSAYSVQKSVQGSAHLAAIKELYFPVLQRLDANIVRIDKLEETYIQVVIAGDRDMLDKAAALGSQTDQAFSEILTLYPGNETQATVVTLRNGLKQYQELATKVSTAFLDQSGADVAPMTASMNDTLAELKKGLSSFRRSSYDAFVQTLNQTQHDARVSLYMGLALGVMNLGFMAVLVFFIRNNVKMMSIIAVQNATLELRVAERTGQLNQKTNDINAMLQNMRLGVSTVVAGNRMHPEYSNYLRTIFGIEDVAGKDVIETLFAKSTLGVDSKDQIKVALGAIVGEDGMMFDFNSHLLVSEMNLTTDEGAQKAVQMEWSPILDEHGNVDKILLITQDVTHLRALEQDSAHQKDELDIISKILRISADKFNSFIESATGYIAANRQLLGEAKGSEAEAIAGLFRNMHTIKGNARTFEFTHITNVAHHAEQTYDALRKDEKIEWNVAQMLAELDAVDAAVARYLKVNEDTLGRKGRAADLLTTRGAFVGFQQLQELRSMAVGLSASGFAPLQAKIDTLGLMELERIASGAVDSLSSLARELNKPTPAVNILGGNMAFNSRFAETLKSCCMHLLRNSLDHGIEAPEERTQMSKPPQGKICFAAARHGEYGELRIGDDGRGLALHKLYDKALAQGLYRADERPTPEAVADLIFRSGLSTSADVTQVSGRGVGMDAVRTFLNEQGATIKIELKASTVELGYTPFEFIIRIPSAAYMY